MEPPHSVLASKKVSRLFAMPFMTSIHRSLILQTPSARWSQGFPHLGHFSTAFASGWMCTKGACARHRVDHGFVLSDHADWSETLWAIAETGAERVLVTHGYVDQLVSHLRGQGLDAHPLKPAAA